MTEELCNRLTELIDEVYEFFTSDQILQRAVVEAPTPFALTRKPISFRITSLKEFAEDIDIRNPRSALKELDEGILGGTLESSWFFFDEYQMHGEFSAVEERIETFFEEMRFKNQPRLDEIIRRTAEGALPFCREGTDFDELHGLLFDRLYMHANRIMVARTIMLGRRNGIAEALFHAYRHGVIPYGFDLDTNCIVCIRPVVD